MISYALITKDKLSYSLDTINSVLRLPRHEYEFIVYCPSSAIQDSQDEYLLEAAGLRYVEDVEKNGSPAAFNATAKRVRGRYISYLLNNIVYPENFLDVVEYLHTEFKDKKFKLVNTMWDAGPGCTIYNASPDINGKIWPPENSTTVALENTPYPVIPLQFIEVETIAKHLEGCLYHPGFKNHYPDHWLGFYLSRHETYKPFNWICPAVQFGTSSYQRGVNTSTDKEDGEFLRKLTDNFKNSPDKYLQ